MNKVNERLFGIAFYKTVYICGMKEWVRIVSSIQLAILYCFAVIFCSNGSAALTSSNVTDLPADGGGYLLLASSEWFATEAQSLNLIKNFEKLPFSAQKNYVDRFVACIRTVELFLVNTYSRYIYHSLYEVDRLQLTDIIFPFQYFW